MDKIFLYSPDFNLDYSQIRAKARRVSSLHYPSLKAVVTEYPENNGL